MAYLKVFSNLNLNLQLWLEESVFVSIEKALLYNLVDLFEDFLHYLDNRFKDGLPKLSLILLLGVINRYSLNSELRDHGELFYEIKQWPDVTVYFIIALVTCHTLSHYLRGIQIVFAQHHLALTKRILKRHRWGSEGHAEVLLCHKFGVSLKVVNVDLIVSNNESPHPTLERLHLLVLIRHPLTNHWGT